MNFTRQDIQKALPANLKSSATQEFVDDLNQMLTDPVLAEHVRDNFIMYSNVLMDGKWSAVQYTHAVMYVTHKLMGRSNLEAYTLTFPDRYAELVAKGTSSKDISAYVSAYHKTKLVSSIMEKCIMPVWVTHVDVYYKALAVQQDLMINSQSDKVRQDAANSILTHLAKPKEAVPTVAIQVNNNNVELNAMKDMMAQLAKAQLDAIDMGVPARELASQKLITVDQSDAID